MSAWNMNPCDHQVIAPKRMGMDSFEIKPELGFTP